MIAPPGSPKIVETPSSMRDWQIALAPFKRIDVLTSVERTIALYLVESCSFAGHKKPRLRTEARSDPRGTTLLGPLATGVRAPVPCVPTLGGVSPATPARPTGSV